MMILPISIEAGDPASRFYVIQQSRNRWVTTFRKVGFAASLASMATLGACAETYIPPTINYDNAIPARLAADPPPPLRIVEVPKPLPLAGQLKPLDTKRPAPEPADPAARIKEANAAARVQPAGAGFINAVQVYPYAAGSLYQAYTAPGEITDIALQEGEQLVGSGPVAAGDTVRWIIGDAESGSGLTKKIHILVKPTRPELVTNLVINTNRRTYFIELRSTPKTYMASVSWQYPEDQLVALRQQDRAAEAAAPVATGVDLAAINFRYAIEGDQAPWRPLRAFDDGRKVYIAFPTGISQGELPPLFVIGPAGGAELVNYRVKGDYYIVDRLFAAAELRLGDKASARRVRIVRTDGVRSGPSSWIRGSNGASRAAGVRPENGGPAS
jgi:type IV secretion system protein VirB9